MSDELRFDDRVAIVTGAGNGLGRSHALLLAARGAKVVVNDLGGGIHGEGKSQRAADAVVDEIVKAGGVAVANYDSVEDGAKIVKTALDAFGRVDIVVNNAGILRDVSFAKMSPEDWELIYRVHVKGSFAVTHAAWPHMREQKYGRVIMTASAAGIYGNFGQANYGMAKLGLVGLSNTLAIEGRKNNVHVNTIAPIAGSRLTETVLPKELIEALRPEFVSPLLAYLCHESCEETGGLFEVGGGFFAKLRWERARGKTFRLGRAITPESVRDSWKEIASFDKAEHPDTIAASMQPIMENVQAGPSRGGNQFIDVDQALGYTFPAFETRYDERDLALYALGVGAAEDPLDEQDLRLVYEMHSGGFVALPTYAVIPPVNGILTMAKEGKMAPGLSFGLDRLLHGEQYTELRRPLPPKATLRHETRVKSIWDKGKNAVLVYETRSTDETGEVLMVNELTAVIRGAGGWGGERGPSEPENVAPDRTPDATAEQTIHANQALLYRLSGDWNPLHVDPSFAKAFGFARPILHGLCTFGYAARHVIRAFAPKGDPRYFKSIKVRFADSVLPGETLVTEMWKEGDTRVVFRCKVKERDKVVISNAAIELYQEIPKPVARKPAAAAAGAGAGAPGAALEPTSADIFAAIARYVKENPDAVKKVGVVYKFALTSPDSTWTVDLKSGAGSVAQGETAPPECRLEMADSDFMDMCTGKADPQKLYFGGKLKISGNVMASQKLTFLSKIDPAWVVEAMRARTASGGGAAASGGGGAEAGLDGGPTSGDVFVAIRDHVERNPDLVKKVATVYQFKLRSPDTVWTLDMKKGEVVAGESAPPDCTLELDDADFMAMVSGQADPQKLYFSGKLKISGNVMASQKLTFLQKMDPERAKEAVLAARKAGAAGGAAAAAAAPARPREPQAPALMDKLGKKVKANPGWVKEVNAVIQLQLTEPDTRWVVDLKNGAGLVRSGGAEKADCVLTISEGDLVALIKGEAPVRTLYQTGKLRVDGDVRVAQRLDFLKSLA
ncbi:MAG TPA: SDR family NAD(P)-dependent oxidoreductase [Kofleriaceae bacterium]|nr:SDR family NAD(P)-dependent oxidoreductase [Kofleriaceae bacterium]